jgi:hypothetical protein
MPLIVSADPPSNAIDARRPLAPTDDPDLGWNRVVLTLREPVTCATIADFSVTRSGGSGSAPQIVAVEAVGDDAVALTLAEPVAPLGWTTLRHKPTGQTFRLGALPGDVNGSGTTTAVDIVALVDRLNGAVADAPVWSVDIDRSGTADPADLTTLIAVLNGDGFDSAYNGASLPN